MPGRTLVQLMATVVVAALAFVYSTSVATGSTAGPDPAQDADLVAAGAQVYADNCVACHQVGGVGVPGSFPPLAGNPRAADADYVASVVRDGLDETIEVLGVTYTTAMQPIDLSDDDREAVAAYVSSIASAEPDATPTTTAAVVGPGGVDAGENLFRGATRFENGGAACVGCHTAGSVGNLGGRSLGPDLTDSVATFGGEAGLSAWLGAPPSETMTPLFADRPLTEPEIADVVAFLADAPDQSQPSYFGDALVWAGLVGLLALMAGMALAWRGMRRTYVEKLRDEAGKPIPVPISSDDTTETPRRLERLRGARQ